MWAGHERERVSAGRQTSLVKTGSRAQNPLHRKGGVNANSRRTKADNGVSDKTPWTFRSRRTKSCETAPPRIGCSERTWSGNPVDHLTKKDFESMDAVTANGNVTVRIVDGAVCEADQAGDADDGASDGGGDAFGVGEVEEEGAGEITTDEGGEGKGVEKETTASTLLQFRDDNTITIDL